MFNWHYVGQNCVSFSTGNNRVDLRFLDVCFLHEVRLERLLNKNDIAGGRAKVTNFLFAVI